MYTHPGQPVALMQAEHNRFPSCVRPHEDSSRDEPHTRNRIRGDWERVYGMGSGCWLSTESFHTGRAIVYTRPGQPVALMQAQHFRFLSCVRPHEVSSRDEPHTCNRIRDACERV